MNSFISEKGSIKWSCTRQSIYRISESFLSRRLTWEVYQTIKNQIHMSLKVNPQSHVELRSLPHFHSVFQLLIIVQSKQILGYHLFQYQLLDFQKAWYPVIYSQKKKGKRDQKGISISKIHFTSRRTILWPCFLTVICNFGIMMKPYLTEIK